MDQQILKQKLLSTGYFEDNEWLDKYCQLIIDNLETKKEKYKTEAHHILQVAYFKILTEKVDNSKENLVNLFYKDHILAHQYLALCTKGKLEISNIIAFNLMTFYESDIQESLTPKQLEYFQILRGKFKKNYLILRGFKSVKSVLKELSYREVYNYYINESHTVQETAKHFDVSNSMMEKVLSLLNITKKYRLNYYIDLISKEDIIKYYIEEGHSYCDTINHFHLEEGMFLKLCNYYNIRKFKRDQEFTFVKDVLPSIDIDKLYEYYITQNHTKKETCLFMGINDYVLDYIVYNYDFIKGKGNHQTSKRGPYIKKISKEDLQFQLDYYNKDKQKIANHYNVSRENLNEYLKLYGLYWEARKRPLKPYLEYNDLYNYYILEGHNKKDTREHFQISDKELNRNLNYYSISKR